MGAACAKDKKGRLPETRDLYIQGLENPHDFQKPESHKSIKQDEEEPPINLLAAEDVEMRPKRLTKIEVAQNSLDLVRKKQEGEDPWTHRLKHQIAQEKQSMFFITLFLDQIDHNQRYGTGNPRMERMTIELKDQAIQMQSQFRQRIITSHQQSRDKANCGQFISPEIDLNETPIPAADPIVPPMNSHRSVHSKNQFSMSSLITFQHADDNMGEILLKAVNDQIMSEVNTGDFQLKQRNTQEAFLQNVQLADKFLNEEGLFYVLQEGLKIHKIQVLLNDQVKPNKMQPTHCRYKSQYIAPTDSFSGTIMIVKLAQIKLKDICQLATRASHLQFELTFTNTALNNYRSLSDSFIQLNQLKSKLDVEINQTLLETEIPEIKPLIWLRLKSLQGRYSLIFTMPTFLDYRKDFFVFQLKQRLTNEPNFEKIQIGPLYKYIEASADMLDPWRNVEFKYDPNVDLGKQNSQIPYGWKLFAVKDTHFRNILEEHIQDTLGYVNIFPNNDSDRQITNVLNLTRQGIPVIRTFSLLKQHSEFKFLQPKSIEVKAYGERKYYQIVLKVLYDKQNTEPLKTGNIILDSGVHNSYIEIVIASNASVLTLIGILVLDEDKSRRATTTHSMS